MATYAEQQPGWDMGQKELGDAGYERQHEPFCVQSLLTAVPHFMRLKARK